MLLLYNKINIHTEIELMLKFADCSEKTANLKVGDRIKLTYRKDFCPLTKSGIIKEINIRVNCNGEIQSELSPYLLMDFSTQYNSDLERICVNDIIDFEMIYPTGATPIATNTIWNVETSMHDGMDAPCYGNLGDFFISPRNVIFKEVSTTITDEETGKVTSKLVLMKLGEFTEVESSVTPDPEPTPECPVCPVCPGTGN